MSHQRKSQTQPRKMKASAAGDVAHPPPSRKMYQCRWWLSKAQAHIRTILIIIGFGALSCLLIRALIMSHHTRNVHEALRALAMSSQVFGNTNSGALHYFFDGQSLGAFSHSSPLGSGSPPFTQGLHLSPRVQNKTNMVEGLIDLRAKVGEFLDNCLAERRQLQSTCLLGNLMNSFDIVESSGLYRQSFVHIKSRDEDANAFLQLPARVFAEGLTETADGDILLTTWRERKLLRIRRIEEEEKKGLKIVQEYKLVAPPHEGWGLASDGTDWLWMTDGTDAIYFYYIGDGTTFGQKGSWLGTRAARNVRPQFVTRAKCMGQKLDLLNELDFYREGNLLLANRWHDDKIYGLNILSGDCVMIIELPHKNPETVSDAVWNGIASISKDWMLFTGKTFPKMYVGKIVPKT